jgi:hypothetical protein
VNLEYQRKWRKNSPKYREWNRKYTAKWRKKHPRRWAKMQAKAIPKHRTKLKLEVLTHYSTMAFPVCADPFMIHVQDRQHPFFTDIDCLTLDRIKGGHGRNATKWGSGGQRTYRILKKKGYPKGWQVLCMNCQFKKMKANKEW